MELLSHTSALFLALIGWSASLMAIFDSQQFSGIQRRFLIVFTWALWTVPAFDVLVYRGLMPTDTALALGGILTIFLVFSVSLTAICWRTRP
jgi:hypothetical protein